MNKEKTIKAIKELLEALDLESHGEEVHQNTPSRVAEALEELTNYPKPELVTFDMDYSDWIKVDGIKFYALCEHHLLPFFGEATVIIKPRGKILGVSKIARLVKYHASRNGLQERITKKVVEELNEVLEPDLVLVKLKATHLCMSSRGVKAEGSTFETIAWRGKKELLKEALSLSTL